MSIDLHPEYLDNKYGKWYIALVNKARAQSPSGYVERHHVLPKSMGGNDAKENLVKLSARQHFIAHALLMRCTTGKSKSRMVFALMCLLRMSNRHHVRYVPRSSTIVEAARQEYSLHISKTLRGRPNTWTKSTSEVQKESLRKVNRERVWTDEQRQRLADSCKSRTGEKRSEEGKKNLSEGAKKRFSVPHITINNGIRNTLIPESKIGEYPGWVRGKVFKKRTKK